MPQKINIFWFRRDLRLEDNAGLYHALHTAKPVLPIFIFDKAILDELEDPKDRRVNFIHDALEMMQARLRRLGSGLRVFHAYPHEVFSSLLQQYEIDKVYANEDYEPYARKRDAEVAGTLEMVGARLLLFKDQVVFAKDEIQKDNGQPYTVFTPYSRKWKAALRDGHLESYRVNLYSDGFYKWESPPIPALKTIGFERVQGVFSPPELSVEKLKNYGRWRDFPAVNGTSRLGVHLRFGTISIRKLVAAALQTSESFLNELIWREFYQSVLWHNPALVQQSFKPEYDNINWRNNEKDFMAWCTGHTGYPIVDAGMRELNQTGYMHNRVRMIVASFLTKHLLIDWRWGEAYFAKHLLDYDLASNNGGWQWAAGSGCDAAPYFRIFNPYLQTKKFDPDLTYIRKWIPELDTRSYPKPVVDHEVARSRCLLAYQQALKKG